MILSNFYEYIKQNTIKSKNRVVLRIDKRKLKNKDLLSCIDSFSSYLVNEIGLNKGDKVAIFSKNSVELIVALFACNKIGVIFTPLNYFCKEVEINYILKDLKPKLFIFDKGDFSNDVTKGIEITTMFIPNSENETLDFAKNSLVMDLNYKGKEVSSVASDDVAFILYTSGTTGRPKGVMLTFMNVISNISAFEERLVKGKRNSFICFLPMFHVFALSCMVLLPLLYNHTTTIVRSVMPFNNVLKQVLLNRITVFLGAPEIYKALTKVKLPLCFRLFHNIKIFISGSAPLSKEVFYDITKIFKKSKFIEGYGLSEASPVVAVNMLNQQKLLSVGKPLDNLEVKIIDDNKKEVAIGEVGEVVVKGPSVMKGYYNMQSETDKTIVNGWLLTGDIGKFDQDNFLYIVDRKKDIIISKGFNIYPKEVEFSLSTIDGIKDCAVIGENKGVNTTVVAYVELENNFNLSANEIKNKLKNLLADYKIPRQIYFTTLPRNALGKVVKKELIG